ncbi:GntP family permease [Novosphingobium rosa]|uniref:GntP family permease n=1 Tax=Novosphingobium rosa TaxID=76978 RepID=UPI00082A8F6B|nr:gluconate:H+ symporter [Novosphingobium rosa]
MNGADCYLIATSCIGIAIAILLIARLGLHPFIGLLTSASVIGLASALHPAQVIADIEKGFADILGSTGLVVALGLGLSAILQVSGGAQALASRALRLTGQRHAALGGLLAAFLIGTPLFFETGVILLLPGIAASMSGSGGDRRLQLKVMLSTLAGLSVLHALVPPHPGPLIAIHELHAQLLPTMGYGLLAAIPTALIAGPLLAHFTTARISPETAGMEVLAPALEETPPVWAALATLLLPVALITSGMWLKLGDMAPASQTAQIILLVSDPAMALLITNLLALPLLLGRQIANAALQATIWREAMIPAGSTLLSIGGGGALKQVLISIGLPALFSRLAALELMSPLLVAWLVAAAIRVATGSATVATISASGIMAGVVAHQGVDRSLFVLAIGAGSVFLSHVNDPGFWLVKSFLGTSTRDTFRTWSVLETVISIMGLLIVLALAMVT